jgi:hypothetical protein
VRSINKKMSLQDFAIAVAEALKEKEIEVNPVFEEYRYVIIKI